MKEAETSKNLEKGKVKDKDTKQHIPNISVPTDRPNTNLTDIVGPLTQQKECPWNELTRSEQETFGGEIRK